MNKHKALDEVLKLIDREELIKILEGLISTPGHIKYPGQEEEISRYVYSILKSENIETSLQEVEKKRFNVIAQIGGNPNGKSLALNGHLDTVPPNDRMKKTKPEIRQDKFYGLGAADMKGAVAAMLYALILIKRSRLELDGSVFFTGVIGEESGGTGTRFLMKNGFKADYFIIGEPTELSIVNSHKGCFLLDVIIHGKAGHASMPEKGANAISAMGDFISILNKDYLPKLKTRSQDGVGNPTLSYGLISGGKKVNIIADRCTLSLDRRWIDSEEQDQIMDEIELYVKKVCDVKSDLTYELIPMLPPEGYFGPFFIDRDHEIISICKKVYSRLDIEPRVDGMQGWTDGATIANEGFPTAIIGPGSMSMAHSPDEYVPVEEVLKALRIYIALSLEICIVQ